MSCGSVSPPGGREQRATVAVMVPRRLVRLDCALRLAEELVDKQLAKPGVPAGVHARRRSIKLHLLRNLRKEVRTLESRTWKTSANQSEEDEGGGENAATFWRIFCTSDCSTVWLLPANERSPDLAHTPPHRRAYGVELRSRDEQQLPKTVGAGTTPGVQFVANTICKGLDVATAKAGTQIISEYLYQPGGPEEVKSALTTLADGLDTIPRKLGAGISWIMTDVFGLPNFFGEVVGQVLASVFLAPFHLHQVATVARVADVVISDPAPEDAGNGILKDVTELMLRQRIADFERGIVTVPPPRPESLDEGIWKDIEPPDPPGINF
jgi:hypothetical protein